MKTRLLIIVIGLSIVGIFGGLYIANIIQNIEAQKSQEEWRELRAFVMSDLGKQKKCDEMGGSWNTDYCLITQETFDSNKLTCEPGPVLEDATCQSNGIKLVLESVIEPECKPEPRPENEGGLWIFDYEKCDWNKKQWWMSDQLEKIIQDCMDPKNKIGDKGMSNGTTKLKTTTCTWQHGGFYNQVYVEEWADPVPLIQDNKIIGPDGQIFKILED